MSNVSKVLKTKKNDMETTQTKEVDLSKDGLVVSLFQILKSIDNALKGVKPIDWKNRELSMKIDGKMQYLEIDMHQHGRCYTRETGFTLQQRNFDIFSTRCSGASETLVKIKGHGLHENHFLRKNEEGSYEAIFKGGDHCLCKNFHTGKFEEWE